MKSAVQVLSQKKSLRFEKITSPASEKLAWQIESFLLKVFRYGDYDFHTALCGKYSKDLSCTFFIARSEDSIIGAAGCLFSKQNPAIALFGPVCVELQYRRRGLGTRLCELLLSHLMLQGCMVVYLGVAQDNPAIYLYQKIGFEKHRGIVMRKFFSSKDKFTKEFLPGQDTIIRRIEWEDYPFVLSLICEPAEMKTVDFLKGIYSTKLFGPRKFLSVFPQMMEKLEKNTGLANVLLTNHSKFVVGIAQVGKLPSPAQDHIAVLDFFVHDNYINQAQYLVLSTLKESYLLSKTRIVSYCLACDEIKRNIIESIGAKRISTLPKYARVENKLIDVFVYQFGGSNET